MLKIVKNVCWSGARGKKVLERQFFRRQTLVVARELLGKFLVRRWRGREIAAMITEVEAYDGFSDKASHASRGVTARNAVMFGDAGRWYVYFTYGMHWMLNVVTREEGYPAAILVRGVVVASPPVIARRPKADEAISIKTNVRLPRVSPAGESLAMTTFINGPARLTKFFHVDKALNDKPAIRKSGLWIEDRGVYIPTSKIKKSPRIGVDYAGPLWAKKRWRFFLALR